MDEGGKPTRQGAVTGSLLRGGAMILPAPSCLKGIHAAVATKFVFETYLKAIKVVSGARAAFGAIERAQASFSSTARISTT
jgi:hypothetical protein